MTIVNKNVYKSKVFRLIKNNLRSNERVSFVKICSVVLISDLEKIKCCFLSK